MFKDDRKFVDRIHRKYQGAMTLTPIDPRLARPLGTDFRRRGPWGAHFARSGNFETHPCRGSNTPMGRRPGEFMIIMLVIMGHGDFLSDSSAASRKHVNNSPGLRPIGVLDPVWGVFRSSQTAQSGRPRAVGGGTRFAVVAPDPGQSPAESWRPVIYEGS